MQIGSLSCLLVIKSRPCSDELGLEQCASAESHLEGKTAGQFSLTLSNLIKIVFYKNHLSPRYLIFIRLIVKYMYPPQGLYYLLCIANVNAFIMVLRNFERKNILQARKSVDVCRKQFVVILDMN